ncbi:MAG TPA: peptidylprolyl isomerase [Alphaproteobacteria bacterium]|nr:peptidylprolyl isomerase [Alphaproteobacteria bacterium]
MMQRRRFLALLAFALSAFAIQPALADGPRVRLTTTKGVIELELDEKRAPESVKNFIGYVESGHYNGTIFHRVIRGFMIQGGGFTKDMNRKQTNDPIRNEADNGLSNRTGTFAMARTSDPHSASAQFFINTVDNAGLDHRSKTMRGWGYAVFGRVVKGMDVVRRIEDTRTTRMGRMADVPSEPIVIEKAEVLR